MRAFLKNYRMAPRKVRLVAGAIRGKNAATALDMLSLMPQKAAHMFRKMISSAVANAGTSADASQFTIARVTVDKGITYERYQPRAFGRASPLRRECSHVTVELAARDAVEQESTPAVVQG